MESKHQPLFPMQTSPLLQLGPGCGSDVPRGVICLPPTPSLALLLLLHTHQWPLTLPGVVDWVVYTFPLGSTFGCSLFTCRCREVGVPGSLGVYIFPLSLSGASPGSSVVKNLPAVQKTQVWSLGWEDPPEKEMANHSSSLAWKIPWTEEPGGLHTYSPWGCKSWTWLRD